jgi:hypothetical protein
VWRNASGASTVRADSEKTMASASPAAAARTSAPQSQAANTLANRQQRRMRSTSSQLFIPMLCIAARRGLAGRMPTTAAIKKKLPLTANQQFTSGFKKDTSEINKSIYKSIFRLNWTEGEKVDKNKLASGCPPLISSYPRVGHLCRVL